MEELVELGQAFVHAMRDRKGLSSVAELYSEDAESVEAVVPPGRDVRVAKGRQAILGKREDWASIHEIQLLSADGPFVHPPNRFAVNFEAKVRKRGTSKVRILREVAVYYVEGGKIVREEFFLLAK